MEISRWCEERLPDFPHASSGDGCRERDSCSSSDSGAAEDIEFVLQSASDLFVIASQLHVTTGAARMTSYQAAACNPEEATAGTSTAHEVKEFVAQYTGSNKYGAFHYILSHYCAMHHGEAPLKNHLCFYFGEITKNYGSANIRNFE